VTIKPLQLSVLTPKESVREADDIEYVHLSLANGYPISIYPGHAPLLAETVAGPLRYADDAGEHTLNLTAGILQVDENVVRVLTGGQIQTAEPEAGVSGVAGARTQPQGLRFDRLAQEMLAALHAQTQGRAAQDGR